jgi:hypothetical protein
VIGLVVSTTSTTTCSLIGVIALVSTLTFLGASFLISAFIGLVSSDSIKDNNLSSSIVIICDELYLPLLSLSNSFFID